jgi:hypothetical protein
MYVNAALPLNARLARVASRQKNLLAKKDDSPRPRKEKTRHSFIRLLPPPAITFPLLMAPSSCPSQASKLTMSTCERPVFPSKVIKHVESETVDFSEGAPVPESMMLSSSMKKARLGDSTVSETVLVYSDELICMLTYMLIQDCRD